MSEIREITRIPTGYFQKSQFFLYPLLNIPPSLHLEQSYMSWDKYTADHYLLTCVYPLSTDPEAQRLEKLHLLGHSKLFKVFPCGEKIIYIFDFSQYCNNWRVFMKGNYSQMSDYAKESILRYYKERPEREKYAHCYLYPELYYDVYAELLQVDVDLFYEGTELTSPPDMEKETCRLEINLENCSTK